MSICTCTYVTKIWMYMEDSEDLFLYDIDASEDAHWTII